MKNRNNVIDIMRAFAIIFVVIGHCSNDSFLNRYIYLFHLPLFFLISGYLYKEIYCEKPWEYIGLCLKKYLKIYIIYNGIFVLLHNLFYRMNLLSSPTVFYQLKDVVVGILNCFLFTSTESFAAALWFLPVLFASMIIFNFINYAIKENKKNKELKRLFLIFALTLIGIYLNKNDMNIGLHYQISLAVLPFIYLGQLIRKKGLETIKINYIIAFAFAILSMAMIYIVPGGVELSKNELWHVELFYLISILMIYVVYVVSTIINKDFDKIKNLLIYIGKNTLSIMGLHILCFKLLDFLVIKLISKNYDILPNFTVSYPKFWIIYTIVGVIFPIILKNIISKFKIKMKYIRYCISKEDILNLMEKILISA